MEWAEGRRDRLDFGLQVHEFNRIQTTLTYGGRRLTWAEERNFLDEEGRT